MKREVEIPLLDQPALLLACRLILQKGAGIEEAIAAALVDMGQRQGTNLTSPADPPLDFSGLATT